jgi:hypothetical protein
MRRVALHGTEANVNNNDDDDNDDNKSVAIAGSANHFHAQAREGKYERCRLQYRASVGRVPSIC